MCDMQKMPSRDEMACDEEDMNFAAFTALGAGGTHFVTTGGQIPITKLQQTMANNGSTLQQVVGMVGSVNMAEGVQYVRSLEGGATLHSTPQLISVPIALPGAKPGDPQPTVQIQVLNPNMLQGGQSQQKYQMQIPIQGFQQGGGAVLAVAYSPDANEAGGIQILGNTLPEGIQVVSAMPQEMQAIQPSQVQNDNKPTFQHQVFITPSQQIVINGPEDNKLNNNTTTNNNNNGITSIVIKEECEEIIDDESSQGMDTCDSLSWQMTPSSHKDLVKYLHQLTPQQAQQLPLSLQQFLKLNPPPSKSEPQEESEPLSGDKSDNAGEMTSESPRKVTKKKKKCRKKPSKPARPKPGQVIIATSSDGTPIYCCPECQNAYSEKEQLEMHLVVHKIERRYICGICGAGLKRKEHLERHKLGHNPDRPYVCGICRKGFKRREHLNLHTVIHSGVKTEMCTECGKGFYRKDHLRKHMRSHETKRLRDEANNPNKHTGVTVTTADGTILNNITIHVPTSSNVQLPVQINIPQHVVSSLTAAQQTITNNDAHMQLDALLAQHS